MTAESIVYLVSLPTIAVKMPGKLYLLPVTLGGSDPAMIIPAGVLDITRSLRYFIAEEIRSARRYLRLIDKTFPVDDSVFFVLNEHSKDDELDAFLEPVLKGHDAGIMSEAGLPCLADPGSRMVALAHRKGIRVVPLSGPSSVVLALIASGLDGQNFSFNGYLPVKEADRAIAIRELEKRSRKGGSHIFIETPYRSLKMLETILAVCNDDTMLCVAFDLTLPSESVTTMRISSWKRNHCHIDGKPAVFILQQI